MLLALVLSVATTVVIFLIGLLMGFSYSPVIEAEFIFKKVGILFGYFLHLFTFLTFCIFIGMLIRKSGFAIALAVFYIYIVEPILTSIIRYYYELELLADAFPRSATLAVVPNPFPKYILMEVQDYVPMDHFLICSGYLLLFTWLSWLLLRKRDM